MFLRFLGAIFGVGAVLLEAVQGEVLLLAPSIKHALGGGAHLVGESDQALDAASRFHARNPTAAEIAIMVPNPPRILVRVFILANMSLSLFGAGMD